MAGLIRTTAVTAGAVTGLSGAMYGLLFEQSRQARRIIGKPHGQPLRADGVHLPDGTGPVPPSDPAAAGALRLAVIGDSSAAGLGVEDPGQLPGVLIASGLAEESRRPVRLDTYAVSGAKSRDLAPQVELAMANRPDLALIMIGANDVTGRILPQESARLLSEAIRQLRAAGVTVVVGTCPDLGAVTAIPQPLRTLARTWGLAIARRQRAAALAAGAHPVPLADLLAAEFLTRTDYFSVDRFHPSAAGYEAACAVLLPAVCAAAGVWSRRPVQTTALRVTSGTSTATSGAASASTTSTATSVVPA